jgi:hypothetical protein
MSTSPPFENRSKSHKAKGRFKGASSAFIASMAGSLAAGFNEFHFEELISNKVVISDFADFFISSKS